MTDFYPVDALRRAIGRNVSPNGFSLVEALLALVVAGVVSAMAGAVMLSQVRMSASIEMAQRQRDDASRLDYLIQIESGEASTVEKSPDLPVGCSGTGKALAAFVIPRDEGSYLSTANVSRVYYYNSGSDIWRCGPPVLRNGRLDHGLNAGLGAGVAVRSASLNLVDCSGDVTDQRQMVYQVVYPAGGYKPGCTVARAKTLFVCNKGESGC